MKGEGRELRVKQRWSRRENENHASAYEEREGKIRGGERRVVSPGKWKFDDDSTQRKKGEGAPLLYARSARAESKKHLESFNRSKSKKRNLHDLSRHAADLRYRENTKFLMVRVPARNIARYFVERGISYYREKHNSLKKLT